MNTVLKLAFKPVDYLLNWPVSAFTMGIFTRLSAALGSPVRRLDEEDVFSSLRESWSYA